MRVIGRWPMAVSISSQLNSDRRLGVGLVRQALV
jgi:hypothetical protein